MEIRRKQKSEYAVQSVERALDILEAFTYAEDELGVTELANKLDLHKNNVFRLLATLETRSYIEQDQKTGNYRLGIKIFEVASVFLHHLGLRRQARPILEELAGKSNETAYLAVIEGTDIVYILMHETTQTVRVMPRLGHRLPGYCTASGKVQLAYETEDRLRARFKDSPLRRFTPNTITDLDRLLEHLAEVARQGIAIDDEEMEEGVRCLAAPVRDYSHRVVAGVGLSGPVSRFSGERVQRELIPLVKEAGLKISQRLGYEILADVSI